MANLGDYLGHLLSEITIARMQADLEAVRVAELYAGHPLLRNLPVPRFRLPDVQIEVPVVIKQVDEPAAGEPPRGAPPRGQLRKTFDKVVKKWLTKQGFELPAKQDRKLKSAIDETMSTVTQPAEVAVDVGRVADELAGVTLRTLTESGGPAEAAEPAKVRMMTQSLKQAVRVEFLKLRKPPGRVQALVTTAEIREAGPGEVLTRLQLKISEEAFEWTVIEVEGREQDRLIPE